MRGEPALSSCSDTRSGHPPEGVFPPTLGYPVLARRSGRVAEGGALLRRYGGTNLHRGFESLLLRFNTSEGWQSGRMRRSRKPFRAVSSDEGSNPSPSA